MFIDDAIACSNW